MIQRHLKRAAGMASIAAAILLAARGAQPTHAAQARTSGIPVTVNYEEATERAPSVRIPKEIYLKNETQCTYTVQAYCPVDELGALARGVTVAPSGEFTLTEESSRATFTAHVTQAKTEFTSEEVAGGEPCEIGGRPSVQVAAQGTISVAGIPKGRWAGAMSFMVEETEEVACGQHAC